MQYIVLKNLFFTHHKIATPHCAQYSLLCERKLRKPQTLQFHE